MKRKKQHTKKIVYQKPDFTVETIYSVMRISAQDQYSKLSGLLLAAPDHLDEY